MDKADFLRWIACPEGTAIKSLSLRKRDRWIMSHYWSFLYKNVMDLRSMSIEDDPDGVVYECVLKIWRKRSSHIEGFCILAIEAGREVGDYYVLLLDIDLNVSFTDLQSGYSYEDVVSNQMFFIPIKNDDQFLALMDQTDRLFSGFGGDAGCGLENEDSANLDEVGEYVIDHVSVDGIQTLVSRGSFGGVFDKNINKVIDNWIMKFKALDVRDMQGTESNSVYRFAYEKSLTDFIPSSTVE